MTKIAHIAFTGFLALAIPFPSYANDPKQQAFDQIAADINQAGPITDDFARKLERYSRGSFYGEGRSSRLDQKQLSELSVIAAERLKRWEAEYVQQKTDEINKLENTVEGIKKIDKIEGVGFDVFSIFPLGQDGRSKLQEVAEAKKRTISQEIGKPIASKLASLPDEISSVESLDALAKEMPSDYRVAKAYAPIREDLEKKRDRIVTQHRQKLCDAALESLDGYEDQAMMQISEELSIRDYVCQAAKAGIEVSYEERGFWPFEKTSGLVVTLKDERTKVEDGALKPGVPVSIDLKKTVADTEITSSPAVIGTKMKVGEAEQNLTTRDWVEFVFNTVNARPWYGSEARKGIWR